ncbi:helix-turn-helix domain-containing protein [Haloactinomyces albus]|uniref:Transcriptional regulator with XRE-family HTH domain n=1 Tax=Haloactinomyces albus TaxID=1352928 RepID=A0AAE4CQZ3_9ACTN|nr:helix-turn-helix transcriptional regulator [Haloactinomyces albus]MDR7303208.1 transcriptional regulator with XRE-family HTH domain [Haloactinomyces albus]
MKESPTARRRALGQALRELRIAAGKNTAEAAALLECSESKIRKIEYGDVPTKVAERNALMAAYGATEEDTAEIHSLAKGANQRGWWQSYRGAVPRWFQRFVGLESAAAEIRTYEVELVPGLLQTESYAHALINSGNPGMPQSEIESRLKVRTERQERLLKDGARLVVVMSEAAIRRVVGGPSVMSEQLTLLLDIQQQAEVEIQVIPYAAGAHPATGFPFVLLRFPDDVAPSLAYTESLTSAAYHDRQADVDTYTLTFDRLRAIALSPADSAALMRQAAEELQT